MSGMRNSIHCHCGQRVIARDVMQTGFYLRLFGPSYVYVKYRCSRCKKLGEQFVKQEEWDGGILKTAAEEVASEDKERFETLGPIDIKEVIDFHFALENEADLKSLEPPHPPAKKMKQRSSSER
jgi:DNA-directed RNA polymerase subunit RPC12/RpoP